jgi:hypothetical protein
MLKSEPTYRAGRKFIVPPPPSTPPPFRIRGEWEALKRERIGKEALAEWSVAIVAEKLKAMERMAPRPLTAVRHSA